MASDTNAAIYTPLPEWALHVYDLSPVSRKVKPYDSTLKLLYIDWLPMILQASFPKQMSNVNAPHVTHHPPHSILLCHDQSV